MSDTDFKQRGYTDKFRLDDEREPILFMRYPTDVEKEDFINILSVPSSSLPTVANRAVVTFEGNSAGGGQWSCSIDRNASSCSHINLSRRLLSEHYGMSDAQESQTHEAGLHFDCRFTPLPCISRSPIHFISVTHASPTAPSSNVVPSSPHPNMGLP
jgi:hypothetical protein